MNVVTHDDVATLNTEIEFLKGQMETLKNQMADLRITSILRGLEGAANLAPGETGYSLLRFDLGSLTVQLADVKSYANGSKVTLLFGNPLSSSINGLTATVAWGKKNKDGTNSEAGTKEVTFKEQIRAGAWTPVTVLLESFTPSELGFMRVSNVAHTGILFVGAGK